VPATLFVDESLHRGVRLAAVRVEFGDLRRSRARMRDQLPPGTRRLHFVKKNDANRRRAFAAIARLDLEHLIVEGPPAKRPTDQRVEALAVVVSWALERGVERIVLERDENNVGVDRRVMRDAVRAAGRPDAIEYVHLAAPSEPLLWIPDAVVWAWSRGGEWRRRAEALRLTTLAA
jgi:hypothetical protein